MHGTAELYHAGVQGCRAVCCLILDSLEVKALGSYLRMGSGLLHSENYLCIAIDPGPLFSYYSTAALIRDTWANIFLI